MTQNDTPARQKAAAELKNLERECRKRRVQKILILVNLLLIIGSVVAERILRVRYYTDFIGISPASVEETRRESYRRAIAIAPDQPEAYLLLLETYDTDGQFSVEESEEFLNLYNRFHNFLPKSAESATIYATAGLLYVNGYDGNASMQLKMALPFFTDASRNLPQDDPMFLPCACYTQIGRFYQRYVWSSSASTAELSKETVEQLLTEIERTLDALSAAETPNVYDQLGFSVAICDLLYSQRDLIQPVAEESGVLALIDRIYENLPEIDLVQKEKSKLILESLKNNEMIYREALLRAYQRGGEKN